MNVLHGTWQVPTPFGPLELVVDKEGQFEWDGRRGTLDLLDEAVRLRWKDPPDDPLLLPRPTADEWWIPLPDSAGVLHFQRVARANSRRLAFASGLELELPGSWLSREVPGATSIHPPSASRPGLPPASFIEVYETLMPRQPTEVLLAAMTQMLTERTGGGVQTEPEPLEAGGRAVWRLGATAHPPTGETIDVKLWVTCHQDHLVAMAQANLRDEEGVPDEVVEHMLETAVFPDWSRDEGLFGTWEQTERNPSGPLTEVVHRTLTLSPDGSYRRVRASILEVDQGSGAAPPPRETRERTGLWYARADQLLASAGLKGYRVQSLALSPQGEGLTLDGQYWSRSEA